MKDFVLSIDNVNLKNKVKAEIVINKKVIYKQTHI